MIFYSVLLVLAIFRLIDIPKYEVGVFCFHIDILSEAGVDIIAGIRVETLARVRINVGRSVVSIDNINS